MKLIANIIYILLFTITFGCSDNNDNVTFSDIKINPTISRVSELNFDHGDQIGLSIYKSTGLYRDNILMTYNENYFSTSYLKWYDEHSKKSTLIAYYPYNILGTPDEISVLLDQSLGYSSCDFMCAVRNDILPSANPVDMLFKHLLSKLSISIINNADANVVDVYICGSIPDADVNLSEHSVVVKNNSEAADIKVYPLGKNMRYEAIIIPQTAALSLKVTMDDGMTHTLSLMSAIFRSGSEYAVPATITNSSINISVSGDIEGWQDGGDMMQDASIEYQGEKYSTITILDRVWMAESLRYIPNHSMVGYGVWYPHKDGVASKDIEDVKRCGMFYSYQVAKSICPAGWRIPTEDDFNSLISDIKPPFTTYIPYAGAYIPSQSRYITGIGLLMGSTIDIESDSSFNRYLNYNLDGNPEIVSYASENGVPLRCVKSIN